MKTEMPEIWGKAKVVGSWVWLEFAIAPEPQVRQRLRNLGFFWNEKRRCWQHSCGSSTKVKPLKETLVESEASSVGVEKKPAPVVKHSKEFKVISLREIPLPESMRPATKNPSARSIAR